MFIEMTAGAPVALEPAKVAQPPRDQRHIFACQASTGLRWQVYKRDWSGAWSDPEPRGGMREIIEYDLRDAFSNGIDLTAYAAHVPLQKLDPDVPLRAGAVCYLPEGSPGLPGRWASINVGPHGCSYISGFGKRPDDEITKALEALNVRPPQPWEFPCLAGHGANLA
jgi:hypothetical protein